MSTLICTNKKLYLSERLPQNFETSKKRKGKKQQDMFKGYRMVNSQIDYLQYRKYKESGSNAHNQLFELITKKRQVISFINFYL